MGTRNLSSRGSPAERGIVKERVVDLRNAILEAQKSGALVRLERKWVEDGFVHGYIRRVGADFFLICVVSGEIRFDGFQALRFCDLSKVDAPAPHHAFFQRALALRKLRRPRDPFVDLTTIATLLVSGSNRVPVGNDSSRARRCRGLPYRKGRQGLGEDRDSARDHAGRDLGKEAVSLHVGGDHEGGSGGRVRRRSACRRPSRSARSMK